LKPIQKKIALLFLVLILLGAAFFWVPRKRPFLSYVKRAEEAFQKKNFNQSIELYLKALKHYPRQERVPEILLTIGNIYNFSLGNTEKAGTAYEMLGTRFPKTFENRRGLQNAAEMHEKTHQYQKALLSYQAIIDNFPAAGDIDETRYKVAMMALKLKKYEPARRSLMAIIEKNPETPLADRVLYQIGNIFFVEGAPREAIQVLKVAIEKFPDSPHLIEMKFTLANAYEERGFLEAAVKIYQQIRDQYPNPVVIDNKIENIKSRNQQSQKVKAKIEKAKAKAKKDARNKGVPVPEGGKVDDKYLPKALNNADGALRP